MIMINIEMYCADESSTGDMQKPICQGGPYPFRAPPHKFLTTIVLIRSWIQGTLLTSGNAPV